jgi:hypothetical protein
MSSEKLYFRVPFDKGHAHFYDTIESFPGLHAGPSFEDREKYIRDTLRHQLLTTSPEQARRSNFALMKLSHSASASVSKRDHTSSSASKRSFPAHP